MASVDDSYDTYDGGISRRRVLKDVATAAIGGGVVTLAGGSAIAASAPAVQTGSVAGRRYRAFVKFAARPASVEELTLRPLGERQVLVRTEASQCCYTVTSAALGSQAPQQATVLGHGGVGLVEAIGPGVQRVRVGDRIFMALTAQCGECYACMRGRADKCMNSGAASRIHVADMQDGTPVYTTSGGMAELNVITEARAVPIFTDLPATELALLHCSGICGLGTTMTLSPVEPGSNVTVFGCGLLGLSAVQGARLKGASQIIGIEPIPSRRQVAMKVGATTVLDPNAEGDNLVQRVRDLCAAKSDRVWAGYGNVGPDFVIEAVGGDLFPPVEPAGPDPTGVLPLQQAWDLCSRTGSVVTTGVGHPPGARVSFPAGQWSNGAKRHFPGNMAGANAKRDLPMYVRLIEQGQFDARSLATSTFPLERAAAAFQAAADRTTVAAIVAFG